MFVVLMQTDSLTLLSSLKILAAKVLLEMFWGDQSQPVKTIEN